MRQQPRRQQKRPVPRDPTAAAMARFDKHFPRIDGPLEQFRTSTDVGARVMRRQAGRLHDSSAISSLVKQQLASRDSTPRREAWREKDRWWRAVNVLHGECDLIRQQYGIEPGQDPSDTLPKDVLERWAQYNCS